MLYDYFSIYTKEETMDDNKDIKPNLIIILSYYVWWFFLGNIYFILLNIPLVFLIIGLGTGILEAPAIWFISLCCIPLGPSLAALMGSMGKLITDKDVSLTKQLFKTYKNSFKQSIIFWTIFSALLTLLYIDTSFFAAGKTPLTYLFYVLIVFVLLLSLNSLSIISKFHLKTSQIIGIALSYSLTHFKVTLFNILTLLATYYIFISFTSYSVLFLSSIFCYCIMYNNQPILKDIEKRLQAAE